MRLLLAESGYYKEYHKIHLIKKIKSKGTVNNIRFKSNNTRQYRGRMLYIIRCLYF